MAKPSSHKLAVERLMTSPWHHDWLCTAVPLVPLRLLRSQSWYWTADAGSCIWSGGRESCGLCSLCCQPPFSRFAVSPISDTQLGTGVAEAVGGIVAILSVGCRSHGHHPVDGTEITVIDALLWLAARRQRGCGPGLWPCLALHSDFSCTECRCDAGRGSIAIRTGSGCCGRC